MSSDSQASETARAFYFGTYRQAGHYLWDEHMRRLRLPVRPGEPWGPFPWRRIDGVLHNGHGPPGRAKLYHEDGWTALAFANYTDDTRPGSNSVFFFEGTLTFDEAVTAARERFPGVVERFSFEIVEDGS